MRSAPDITNVVEACNLDGRQERLENMLSQLEMCEKALQDYLETKRIAFPRFYFVAPADLLDILSKGSNPQLILRHLPKCFDNVHNLSFRWVDGRVAEWLGWTQPGFNTMQYHNYVGWRHALRNGRPSIISIIAFQVQLINHMLKYEYNKSSSKAWKDSHAYQQEPLRSGASKGHIHVSAIKACK